MGRQETASSTSMDSNFADLLMSHDELEMVCQIQMAILLDMGLDEELNRRLKDKEVTPGFAKRSEEVKQKFHRERLMLMASGEIQ
jgi:hypothetical protein